MKDWGVWRKKSLVASYFISFLSSSINRVSIGRDGKILGEKANREMEREKNEQDDF